MYNTGDGQMFTDSLTGRALLFGGFSDCDSDETTLQCTSLLAPDTAWGTIATAALGADVFPGARQNEGAAFLASAGDFLMSGGNYIDYLVGTGPEPVSPTDAWIWRSEASEPAAHVFWIGVDVVVDATAKVSGVDVDWVAGCDAHGKSGVVSGCRLLVWNGVAWQATTTTHASPALLHWSSASDPLWMNAPDLRTMTVGGNLLIALLPAALAPAEQQNMGAEPYTVATDAVSATLSIGE